MAFCKYCPAGFQSTVEREEHERECSRRHTPPAEEDRGLTLRQAAERLMELSSKIDRASSEDEENRLCDERDRLLAMMRKADALLSSPRVEETKMRELFLRASTVLRAGNFDDLADEINAALSPQGE